MDDKQPIPADQRDGVPPDAVTPPAPPPEVPPAPPLPEEVMYQVQKPVMVRVYNVLAYAQQKGTYLTLSHDEQRDILDLLTQLRALVQPESNAQRRPVKTGSRG